MISDAQIALAALKNYLVDHDDFDFTEEELSWYFGGLHIPDSIIDWAAFSGEMPESGTFVCDGDNMAHVNKGAVGLFLNYVDSGSFKNVKVSRIRNDGELDALGKTCAFPDYKGRDVRGVCVVNSNPALDLQNIKVRKDELTADGKVRDVDIIITEESPFQGIPEPFRLI